MKVWFSCKDFTVQLETDDKNVIVKAAPILRKFIGQMLDNLKRWKPNHEIVILDKESV